VITQVAGGKDGKLSTCIVISEKSPSTRQPHFTRGHVLVPTRSLAIASNSRLRGSSPDDVGPYGSVRLVGTERPSALKRFRKLFVFRSRGHREEESGAFSNNDVPCRRLGDSSLRSESFRRRPRSNRHPHPRPGKWGVVARGGFSSEGGASGGPCNYATRDGRLVLASLYDFNNVCQDQF